MQKTSLWGLTSAAVGLMLGLSGTSVVAQPMQAGSLWSYVLVDGSQLVDDCPICDRVPIVKPMRGTFQLRLSEQGPLFVTYALENIVFTAGDTNDLNYKVVGKGTYRIGGEVAVLQDLFLEVSVDNGFTNQPCRFTNAISPVARLWPMLQVGVDQTNGTLVHQFHLDIMAAPLREIWFSPQRDFKAGIWNMPTNLVSAGDLISSAGRVVSANQALTRNLGFMPGVPAELGLKDVDVLAGGEIAFSIETAMWSETLQAQILPGDLLSDQGRVLRSNQEMIAAFAPQPPLPADVGLDAVQVMDNGDVSFSVQTNFFSEKLGCTVQHGDLLSAKGAILKNNANLIGRFNPANPAKDYGLKGIYIWPSGEIWFSTQQGFYNSYSNYYSPGDLLSDQGYVVYRNWELLSAFQPSGSVADLGLDALFIVTDVASLGPAATLGLPQLTNHPPDSLVFARNGGSRVFQLERATNATGPYIPISLITTDALLLDAGALTNQAQALYRLHQW